jgi:hypothetical protein
LARPGLVASQQDFNMEHTEPARVSAQPPLKRHLESNLPVRFEHRWEALDVISIGPILSGRCPIFLTSSI